MALTQKEIDAIINYATEQITKTIETTNVEDSKDVQRMYLAIQQIYEELGTVASQQIPPALLESYAYGLEHAIKQLGQLGIGMLNVNNKISDVLQAPLHQEAISNIVSDTMSDLAAAFRTAKQYTLKEVNNAIDNVKQEIANGIITGMTDRQISQRVGKKFGERGFTSFVTSDGKHLPLDFYAKAVTRTKIQTAQNHAHLNRYDDVDVTLVKVTGNVPTCHECAKYRDIVFSTKPGNKDFPHIDLYTTFPKHPHCQCNFRPYIKKFKSDEDIEQEKTKAQQFDPDTNNDPRSQKEKNKYNAEQKAKAKARRQRYSFNKLQSHLGSDGPKDLKEYKRASKWQKQKWIAQLKGLTKRNITQNTQNDVILKQQSDSESRNAMRKKLRDYSTQVWDSKLDEDERNAINTYTTNIGKVINLALISREEPLPEIKNYIKNIESAINKFDLKEDLIAFRGISKKEFDIIDLGESKTKMFLQFKSTSIEHDVSKKFSSMSIFDDENFMNDERYGLIVNIPKGSNGAYIEHLSEDPSEMEFLLNKDVGYKILNKYDVENWHYIEIEVLNDE